MIQLDNPWLRAAMGDNAPHQVIADWLNDERATREDIIALYVGTPSDYLDGIPGEVLLYWLRHHDPKRRTYEPGLVSGAWGEEEHVAVALALDWARTSPFQGDPALRARDVKRQVLRALNASAMIPPEPTLRAGM